MTYLSYFMINTPAASKVSFDGLLNLSWFVFFFCCGFVRAIKKNLEFIQPKKKSEGQKNI